MIFVSSLTWNLYDKELNKVKNKKDLDNSWTHDYLFKNKNKTSKHLFSLVNFINTIFYESLVKSYSLFLNYQNL